jgi:hypothetical protein
MSILEAFACGIAVIATPVGAVEDVITHESNGLLVPVGDVDALANAIRRLIEDRTLREALGAAAQRDHAKHYEIGAYISRLTAIWFNAADSVNRRQRNEFFDQDKDLFAAGDARISITEPTPPVKLEFQRGAESS